MVAHAKRKALEADSFVEVVEGKEAVVLVAGARPEVAGAGDGGGDHRVARAREREGEDE